MKKPKKELYSLAVLLSGCLWGLMGFFRRRMGIMGFDSFGVIFIRCGIAAILFLITILFTDPGSVKIRLKDVWCFIGSGLCSLLFFSACYFQAMERMSLSAAAILLYTSPCFVIILSSVFFREKITRLKLTAMGLSFIGCCFVSGIIGSELKISLTGIVYGIGAGFGYALYSIFGKMAFARGYKSNTVNFWSCLLASTGAAVIWGIRQPLSIMVQSPGNFWFCVTAAAVTAYLPYLLYTYGLNGLEAGKASVIASVEPVVAALVGLFLFGETLSGWAVIGIILVLTAIILLNTKIVSPENEDIT